MLYLVTPNRTMMWSDLPSSVRVSLLKEDNMNLDRLEWKSAELRADDTIIRLALRYGLPSQSGIVVDGYTLSDHRHAAQMLNSAQEVTESYAKLTGHHELIEKLVPGSDERRRKIIEASDESTREAIAEAEAKVAKMIDEAEPDDALVRHWGSLGGATPAIETIG